MKKFILATSVLTVYPPAELTRVVLMSGQFYYPDRWSIFIAEIVAVWFGYALTVGLVVIMAKDAWKCKRLEQR